MRKKNVKRTGLSYRQINLKLLSFFIYRAYMQTATCKIHTRTNTKKRDMRRIDTGCPGCNLRMSSLVSRMVSLLDLPCRTSSGKSIQRATHTLSPDGPATIDPTTDQRFQHFYQSRAIHLFTAEYRGKNGTRRIDNGNKLRGFLTLNRAGQVECTDDDRELCIDSSEFVRERIEITLEILEFHSTFYSSLLPESLSH